MLQTRVSVSEDMVLEKNALRLHTEVEQRKQTDAWKQEVKYKSYFQKLHPKEDGTSDSWYSRPMFPNYMQKCSPVFY